MSAPLEASTLLAQADRYNEACLLKESPPRVEELARKLRVPLRTFVGKFHAATGLTPSDYLKSKQILVAVGLLASTDLSIAAVAYAAAFGTRRSFAAQFHKRTGVSPDDFRRLARNSRSTLRAQGRYVDSTLKKGEVATRSVPPSAQRCLARRAEADLVLFTVHS